MLLGVHAKSEKAGDGGHAVWADKDAHSPQQLLAVADLRELLGASPTCPGELLDERFVKIAPNSSYGRFGVEAWLTSSGEESLHLYI